MKKTYEVNNKARVIKVFSETMWNELSIGKDFEEYGNITAIADGTAKTKEGYTLIAHFTVTAKASKKKVTAVKAKQKVTTQEREIRTIEVISSNAYMTIKGKDDVSIQLAEVPTMILDIALMLKRNEKPVLTVTKERKAYVLNYVKGYKSNKVNSYNRNCNLAGNVNVDKAIQYIASTLK